jgi:hypothetical protein
MAKPMTQDKVRQVMKEAGFSGVNIIDAAYLVQATTKDGDQILVLVNAPMLNRTAASGSASGSGASGGTAGSGAASSGASGTGGAGATSGGTGTGGASGTKQ